METLVRTAEAARIAGFSTSFLYHHHQEIPAVRRIGRNLRWDIQALLEWMESQANGNGVNGSDGKVSVLCLPVVCRVMVLQDY